VLPLQYNPYSKAFKDFLADIVPGACTVETGETVDRIMHNLTKSDSERFFTLVNEVYKAGYVKAAEVAAEVAKTQGINLRLGKVKPVEPK